MSNLYEGEVLLELYRNDMVESVHAGHLLILNGDGSVNLSKGSTSHLIYPRSSIKAIQAAAMVRAGLQLSPRQIALVCASHVGSPMHLQIAQEILASVGLDESYLRNTPGHPLGTVERRAWADKEATPLAANCSGKHAGMVATAKINGWDVESYREPSHLLQIACKNEFEKLSGEKITKVAVDGCGAPLFAITLSALARAIHILTISNDPIHTMVTEACRNNPEVVSGEHRLPTVMMQRVDGLFAKDGAEGVMVISLRDGRTVAWKMSDGSQRGAGTLAAATLSHLGVDFDFERENVYGAGQVVGEIRVSRL